MHASTSATIRRHSELCPYKPQCEDRISSSMPAGLRGFSSGCLCWRLHFWKCLPSTPVFTACCSLATQQFEGREEVKKIDQTSVSGP